MTQMMLFDAPSGIATTSVYPARDFSPYPKPSHGKQIDVVNRERFCGKRTGSPVRGFAKQGSEASIVDGDTGVQRMGDLARLVLLRYDLMAKRRASHTTRRCAR